MAGSAGNWFKAGPGAKGSYFISNAAIVRLAGGVAKDSADMAAAKEYLRRNGTPDLFRMLAADSEQPAGQAKSKLPPAPVKPSAPAVFAPNVTVMATDHMAKPLGPKATAALRKRMGEDLGLGRPASDAEIAGMVGALDGARIRISWSDFDEQYSIRVNHPLYNMYRQVAPGDPPEMLNVAFAATPGAPPGVGSRVVARQMDQLAKLGIRTVLTLASHAGTDNGYYTWPRLGYNNDAPFTMAERNMMPAALRGAKDLIDLFSMPGGPDWWRENGWEHQASFDTTPGSRSRQALDDYLAVKGIDPYAPFP